MFSLKGPASSSKEKTSEITEPVAFVSLSGQIIECSETFASLFGQTPPAMKGVELTSLAEFSSPADMLEAAYKLDHLDNSENSLWREKLKSSATPDSYYVEARKSTRKINGKYILEARAVAVLSPETSFCRRESLRQSARIVESKIEEISSNHYGVQRVLVVEDSPTALKLMSRMITRLGHEVMTATNGVDALQLLQTDHFDIVLMDINMPQMNGLEASHAFRQIEQRNRASGRPYQKIIAMSGDISNTLFHEVTNAGFDAFIPKPLTEERFYEVLRIPIDKHK
jgi:CheY-like chemotaxis protein